MRYNDSAILNLQHKYILFITYQSHKCSVWRIESQHTSYLIATYENIDGNALDFEHINKPITIQILLEKVNDFEKIIVLVINSLSISLKYFVDHALISVSDGLSTFNSNCRRWGGYPNAIHRNNTGKWLSCNRVY